MIAPSVAYFVMIVAQEQECLFGGIVGGEMWLNEWGVLLGDVGWRPPDHFPHAC
jgi:hypothetical protein